MNSFKTLPRPKNWMPGPPAPWSGIATDKRKLTTKNVETLIEQLNHKKEIFEHLKVEVPLELIEDLGDNDISLKKSAVLVPCIIKEDYVDSLIFMTRTMKVTTHKGQISFPGGMYEDPDLILETTALRENHEETGIAPKHFEIKGRLTNVATRSLIANITPVVGYCDETALNETNINPDEVEILHQIKIAELLKPDNYYSEIWDYGNFVATIHMYFVKDTQDRDVFIWGATAHIVTELLHSSALPS